MPAANKSPFGIEALKFKSKYRNSSLPDSKVFMVPERTHYRHTSMWNDNGRSSSQIKINVETGWIAILWKTVQDHCVFCVMWISSSCSAAFHNTTKAYLQNHMSCLSVWTVLWTTQVLSVSVQAMQASTELV